MTKTGRRSFLRAVVLLAGAGAALVLGLWRLAGDWRAWRRPAVAWDGEQGEAAVRIGDAAATIVAALRDEFTYLQIEPAVVERFARDYLADRRRSWRPGKAFSQRDRQRFLMSTDFFQNGGDEGRVLRYVAYYEPYRSPCYNPLGADHTAIDPAP